MAGELDGELRRRGRGIDPEDTMIAGIGLERDEGPLTRNVRQFGRIDGLKVVRY